MQYLGMLLTGTNPRKQCGFLNDNREVIGYALRNAHDADRSKQSKQVMEQRKVKLILHMIEQAVGNDN